MSSEFLYSPSICQKVCFQWNRYKCSCPVLSPLPMLDLYICNHAVWNRSLREGTRLLPFLISPWIHHVQYKKRLILRCIHHLISDLINNMDHMRISGTKPCSVILNRTKYFKNLKKWCPKLPKQAKTKRDGIINTLHYNFSQLCKVWFMIE